MTTTTMTETVAQTYALWQDVFASEHQEDRAWPSQRCLLRNLEHLIADTVGDVPLSELNAAHVDRMCERMTRGGWIVNSQRKVRAVPYAADRFNNMLNTFKRFCRWAATYRGMPMANYDRILLIRSARPGRRGIKTTKPVAAVPWEVVEQYQAFLPPLVHDVFRLQFLAGMRPGETLRMRWQDISEFGEGVCLFSPPSHKKERIGQQRTILLGPRSLDVLRPYRDLPKSDYLFPGDLATMQNWMLEQGRKTLPSNQERVGANGERIANKPIQNRQLERYLSQARRRAQAVGVELVQFAPNQLRHGRATEVRHRYNLEAAAAFIQDTPSVARVYAERSLALAAAVAKEIG